MNETAIQPAVNKSMNKSMDLLSRLLLAPAHDSALHETAMLELKTDLLSLSKNDFDDLSALASSNHVIVRGLEAFVSIVRPAGDDMRTRWAEVALAAERARIANAIPFLHSICECFAKHGLDVAVIKSLDHLPDLGSDLDLYTDAGPDAVHQLMKSQFDARMAPRSWGDRLARKWNFMIPGLPEAVEIHVGRLGQTGEQVAIASSLLGRTRSIVVDGLSFRATSISDRLMISTLQRMYRHFYFRLCDVIDSASLVDAGTIDYADLRAAATAAGIWEGIATYLVIVSDYVERYRGDPIDLPRFVRAASRFGGDSVYYAREFLRVPILPESAGLYGSQLTGMFRRREMKSGARLSLLPWLATAAVVGQKITGSDKGIW